MKLSECIRLGSMLGSQYFGSWFGHDNSSCALGAASLAIGCADGGEVSRRWEWGWDESVELHCPECGQARRLYAAIIAHLNDKHRWSRERIADWVATIEPEESPSVVVEEPQEALKAAQ